MRANKVWSLVAIIALFAAACGDEQDEQDEQGGAPYGGDLVKSDTARVTSPQLTQAVRDKLKSGNKAFALDLYARAAKKAGNIFFSPHSISTALAMLTAGARGTTETEINKALSFTLPQADLHPAFNYLDQELATRGKGASGADGGKFRLNVINATWTQRDFKFLPAYLDTLAKNYGAGVRLLDFAADKELARKTINAWVAHQTNKRIKELMPKSSIKNDTKLVLTNAIYFNAAWLKPFLPANTKNGSFTTQAGGAVTVPMMKGNFIRTRYHKGTGFQAVWLDYEGQELSMILLVPDKGKLQSFEQGLTTTLLDSVINYPKTALVNLTWPRFKFEHRLPLVELLKALGMKQAFTVAADLSGITGKKDLMVTDAQHMAFVSVNEAGTEAAAATGVVGGPTSAPPKVDLDVDRPFLFLIRDHKTGAILFMGRVSDPS